MKKLNKTSGFGAILGLIGTCELAIGAATRRKTIIGGLGYRTSLLGISIAIGVGLTSFAYKKYLEKNITQSNTEEFVQEKISVNNNKTSEG